MESISSLNNSLFTDLINSYPVNNARPQSFKPVEPVEYDFEDEYSNYDFSNYSPPEEHTGDPVVATGENVIQSAQNLENVMVAALENGLSVQDACNIKMAQMAYKASCAVFKTTFELKV